MPSLTSSQPNLFPWRPKKLCGVILNEILAGNKEEAGRRFKPSKDPPKIKLHNARPKLFPWRPKGSSCLAFNFASSRKVCFVFLGSSYATSSREEHTVFKPPWGKKKVRRAHDVKQALLGRQPKSLNSLHLFFRISCCCICDFSYFCCVCGFECCYSIVDVVMV